MVRERVRRFLTGPGRGLLGRVESRYWHGLRLAAAGGMLAFIGAGLAALGVVEAGRALAAIGIVLGAGGIAAHLVLLALLLLRRGRR